MNIGKNIKTLRQKKGLTQKDLAEKLNVTPQAVSRWELDAVEPSLDTLKDMTDLFNVTLDQLMDPDFHINENKKPETPIIINVSDQDSNEKDNGQFKPASKEEQAPIIGKCCICGEYVHAGDCIEQHDRRGVVTYTCNSCANKRDEEKLQSDLKTVKRRRIKGWIYSCLTFAIALAIAIIGVISNPSAQIGYDVLYCILLPVLTFTTTFTIYMKNNFLGDMWLAVASWGCVKLPGVIFSLDIGGFIFLIVAKIFLFLLSLILIICSMGLATLLAFFGSIIAFPIAVYRAYKKPLKSL